MFYVIRQVMIKPYVFLRRGLVSRRLRLLAKLVPGSSMQNSCRKPQLCQELFSPDPPR